MFTVIYLYMSFPGESPLCFYGSVLVCPLVHESENKEYTYIVQNWSQRTQVGVYICIKVLEIIIMLFDHQILD